MANENNALLCVYTAETDELLRQLMEKNGDLNRISVFRYPEIQKSPKEQAHVADVLIDLVKSGHNQVVYTHSVHIFNRLNRRIVEDGLEGEKSGLFNKVKFYFACENESKLVVKEIELDEKYGLLSLPEGFMDLDFNEKRAVMAAIMKKEGTLK